VGFNLFALSICLKLQSHKVTTLGSDCKPAFMIELFELSQGPLALPNLFSQRERARRVNVEQFDPCDARAHSIPFRVLSYDLILESKALLSPRFEKGQALRFGDVNIAQAPAKNAFFISFS
jgi:hypothetical protein